MHFITGARYSGAHTNQAVFVLTPDQAQVNGITSDFIWPDKVQGEPDFNKYRTVNFSATDSWDTQTATALVLRPGDRIAYGTYEGADASKSRCFISDITVEVLELMEKALTE